MAYKPSTAATIHADNMLGHSLCGIAQAVRLAPVDFEEVLMACSNPMVDPVRDRTTNPRRTSDLRVLSIRQPWAWLIVSGIKDIENRSWSTKYRGRLLIHASSKKPSAELLRAVKCDYRVKLPDRYEVGGIVGVAELVDCVTASRSRWMLGPIGWKLKNARPLPFFPLRGKLRLFRLSEPELKRLQKHL